ncbi:MAG: glycosyltransferase family 2 protein [Chloroflexi bacterium]|nr:glycosyltransferase family 2 protein [Chloroflexota bacterium]
MISVIIVNWNGKQHLDDCLSSLRRQTFTDFEIIMVDNGSTDDSVAYVQSAFPEVQIISLPINTGFCVGNNCGIRAAQGGYIALLNNDTEVDPHWLEELYRALESTPQAGFCASKILLFDQRNILDSAGDYYSCYGAAGKIGRLKPDQRLYDQAKEVFGASGAAAIYRRAMLEEIGLLDEDFFMIYEDVDLSFRAQLMGYSCLYVPTARVYHKVNASVGFISDRYIYYGHRNVEYVYMKNMPSPILVEYLPIHILYTAVAFVFFAMKRKVSVFVRSKVDAFKSLPIVWRKRQEIQRTRRVSNGYISSIIEKDWLLPRIREKIQSSRQSFCTVNYTGVTR